jgi:hypothetical protein
MDTGSIIPTNDNASKSNNTIVNAPQANNVVNNSTYAGGLTGVRNNDPSIHKSFVAV